MELIEIQESFNQVIKRFSLNPYYYFYEKDIRVDL